MGALWQALVRRLRRLLTRPWWLAEDDWFGDDKLSHLGWGAFIAALELVAGASFLGYWRGLFLAALTVELVELWRYVRWERANRPYPWPILTDLLSYKDIVWTLAGGLLAPPLVLLARWIALW